MSTCDSTSNDGAFASFLSSLNARDVDGMYDASAWCALAVLRASDGVAKQLALRLALYVASNDDDDDDDGGWFTMNDVDAMAIDSDEGRRAVRRSVQRLARARAIEVTGASGATFGECAMRVRARAPFARSVRRAIESGFTCDDEGEGNEGEGMEEARARAPDRAALDAYAKSKWEDLLLTLTGASDSFARSQGGRGRLDPVALFRAAGLTTGATSSSRKDGKRRARDAGVTAAGFRFLLTTAQEQIWVLLTQYLRDSQSENATSAIGFMLRLSFQRPGRAYAMTGVLSDTEQEVVRDLTQLGLLYTFEANEKWYYVPTLLSSGLSSGGFDGEGERAAAADGHIIVETNYRVYAYTSSAVEMEILRLFTRADYRLPNLYVGMLTRESVQNALRAGVDAEQIVWYIRAHAHKQVRRKKPSVPSTVCDQIRLWARDMDRVRLDACVLYCDFPQAGGFYDAVANEAEKRGALLWRDDSGRKLTVRADAHESMKAVVAALKQKFA